MKLKNKKIFFRLSSVLLLLVFSLAITPWSLFHHHEAEVATEHNCSHSYHVKSSSADCFVCHAHFEKNYLVKICDYTLQLRVYFFVKLFPISIVKENQNSFKQLRAPPLSLLISLFLTEVFSN